MYHSITFGDKNTWDDWCLIPETEPIVAPPTQKTNYIDVPGADGSLDMSDALTGYPVFNNREGSFTFIAMNKNASFMPECSPFKYRDLVSQIMGSIHGKKLRMILEDDDQNYYEGRFELENLQSNHDFNKITIKYNLSPYKWSILSTIDNWLWDPFNFVTGVITNSTLKNMTVTTAQKVVNFDKFMIGSAPVAPKFIVSANNGQGVYVRLVNTSLRIDTTLLLPNGSITNPDLFLYGDNVQLYYWVSSGSGTLSVEYRQGRL